MRQLAAQTAELQRLNETKNKFLGMAAHDMRTPLAAIRGYSGLLRKSAKGDTQIKLATRIESSSERMLRIIEELLDLSKIESGEVSLNLREIDINEFFDEIFVMGEVVGAEKSITLERAVADDIGSARFDRDYMHQVFDNLLANAFKFSLSGTSVTLGAEKKGGSAHFWVKDQGVGISTVDLPHVFEPFSKLASEPPEGERGHGLGLAIVRRIVDLHGGSIDVQSQERLGTTVTITIPLRP